MQLNTSDWKVNEANIACQVSELTVSALRDLLIQMKKPFRASVQFAGRSRQWKGHNRSFMKVAKVQRRVGSSNWKLFWMSEATAI